MTSQNAETPESTKVPTIWRFIIAGVIATIFVILVIATNSDEKPSSRQTDDSVTHARKTVDDIEREALDTDTRRLAKKYGIIVKDDVKLEDLQKLILEFEKRQGVTSKSPDSPGSSDAASTASIERKAATTEKEPPVTIHVMSPEKLGKGRHPTKWIELKPGEWSNIYEIAGSPLRRGWGIEVEPKLGFEIQFVESDGTPVSRPFVISPDDDGQSLKRARGNNPPRFQVRPKGDGQKMRVIAEFK